MTSQRFDKRKHQRGRCFSPRSLIQAKEETNVLVDRATFGLSDDVSIQIVAHRSEDVRELHHALHRSGCLVGFNLVDEGGPVLSEEAQIVLVVASDPDLRIEEVCRVIKEKRPDLPIMLIGPDAWATKLRFFGLGVEDYVLLSIDRVELIARIRSLIRRGRLLHDTV